MIAGRHLRTTPSAPAPPPAPGETPPTPAKGVTTKVAPTTAKGKLAAVASHLGAALELLRKHTGGK